MSKPIELNEYIYYLLIERDLNHFTITALRDILLTTTKVFKTPVEARVLAYRQVARLVKKDLLVRDKNPSPKRAKYSKTSLFTASSFTKLKNRHSPELVPSKVVNNTKCFESELAKAEEEHLTDVLIVESEIAEYQRIMNEFPQNKELILPFYDKGQLRLLSLKGKLAALINVQRTKTGYKVLKEGEPEYEKKAFE
jgi:hypothetical protein